MTTTATPKLGKRLNAIYDEIPRETYDHIWDCCCDHGLLGMRVLEQGLAPHVHFVDIVPELMHQLEVNLERFFPINKGQPAQWQVHCSSASAIPIQNHASTKHLVVIAGVGGDLTAELVQTIHTNNPKAEIDFLLCPVRHLYHLRCTLKSLNFGMLNETLVEENKRIYEVLYLCSAKQVLPRAQSTSDINEIGEQIWQPNSLNEKQTAQKYLEQQIRHYEKQSKSAINSPAPNTPLELLKQIRRCYF